MAGSVGNVSTLEVGGKTYTMPELLRYWINEREAVRVHKEAGESRPWSDDPIFQRVYFTNVHREDDRVTRWIRQNYTPDVFGEFYESAIVAARIFNWPPTLEQFKLQWFPVSQPSLNERLKEWGAGNKTWGNAYVITTHGQKMSKVDFCVNLLQEAEEKLRERPPLRTCQEFWTYLQRIDGIGSFLAAQVVADLKHTAGHVLAGASDFRGFSAPGPGSLRGLHWFFGYRVSPSMFHSKIDEVRTIIAWDGDMQDLQNCLCEFDKYCRVATGQGRSKRNYAGA